MTRGKFNNNEVGVKVLTDLPGGLKACYVKLESGFKGIFFFSEDKKSIMKKVYICNDFFNASTIFSRQGFDSMNVAVAHMQQKTEELLKKTKKDNLGYYREEKVFEFSKKLINSFFDERGNVHNKVKHCEGSEVGVAWVTFFVKERPIDIGQSPEASIDYDNRRTASNAFNRNNTTIQPNNLNTTMQNGFNGNPTSSFYQPAAFLQQQGTQSGVANNMMVGGNANTNTLLSNSNGVPNPRNTRIRLNSPTNATAMNGVITSPTDSTTQQHFFEASQQDGNGSAYIDNDL